jgi:membrane-associated phospholipid phosphatase
MICSREERGRTMLAVAAVSGMLALALTIAVVLNPAPAAYDLPILKAVQEYSPRTGLATVVNAAGSYWEVSFVFASLLLLLGVRCLAPPIPDWRCRSDAISAFALALALLPLNGALKVLVGSPRPDPTLGVYVDYTRHSYGFPSGHVYSDVLFYGVLAIYAPYWAGGRLLLLIRVAAIAIIVLSGWARMVVGAHWPTDALGGYLWGIAALALVVGLATLIGRRLHPQPLEI